MKIDRDKLIQAIKDEDWWTPNSNDPYTVGDNDGKIRVIDFIENFNE